MQLFAFGKKEGTVIKTQNDEWVLCITSFDAERLPADKMYMANIISREIVDRLNVISYRTRISPEYAYYEEFAWARARSTASKAIATKMDERSAELFRGNPGWRYRQNVARIDKDLVTLRANLEEIDNNAPLINKEPEFKLTRGNLELTFPAAPKPGEESRFCTTQNADAFLTGSIVDFHGRFILTVKLYTVYTQSYVWEDSIIFSQDDIDYAVANVLQRLIVLLGGNEPAVLVVTAEPEETLVLINRSFAGRGSIDSMEFPPSEITIEASAPDHESITFKTTLEADELVEISINLIPLRYTDVRIEGSPGGKVYHGALFVGEAPLTLRLPVNQLEYIEIETSRTQKGTLVFETPESPNFTSTYSIKTKEVVPARRVDSHRKAYYWAWGGTWITGLAAWVAYQSFIEANNSLAFGANTYGIYNDEFGNNVQLMNVVSFGALCTVATVGVYSIYRFFRYLYTANRGATPLASSATEQVGD